ncbi:hypothetical protein KP509_1Z314800 [Ceratopteris richardii]|nr:hypothetical protein KP509_1Z314800 [Ceratopteris richardii]
MMFLSFGCIAKIYKFPCAVIRRAPHEFKISCLEGIRDLFPTDVNPFYAGFGNRITDEISYLKVGIPKGKIFIINPKGEVVVNHRVDCNHTLHYMHWWMKCFLLCLHMNRRNIMNGILEGAIT